MHAVDVAPKSDDHDDLSQAKGTTTTAPDQPPAAAEEAPPAYSCGSKAAHVLYYVGAIGVGLYALVVYGILSPANVMALGAVVSPGQRIVFQTEKASIYLHATFSGLALCLTPFQITKWLRQYSLNMHRWVGRVYVGAVAVGSVTGFLVALKASGGVAAQAAFGILAVLWFTCTLVGVVSILMKRVAIHRRAMLYSSALAFSAVTLRLFLSIGLASTGGNFDAVYPVVAWLCFVPNIPFVEALLQLGIIES